jgi:integrase
LEKLGFKSKRISARKERYRALVTAILNYSGKIHNFTAPKLPKITFTNTHVRYLSKIERDRLLEAYSDHTKPIFIVLCYQGCRTQEALQLKWKDINLINKTIFIAKSKNGEPRTIPMHNKVYETLLLLKEQRILENKFENETNIFLNKAGKPYKDTRGTASGGNPLKTSHKNACTKANIKDFKPHDWRHHWASWAVMSGIDFETIRRMGGWKSYDMLQRYAAVCTKHMQEAINRID